MDLTLNRKAQRDVRRFSLTTASKVDPSGPINGNAGTEVVIWADCAFVFAVGDSPSVVLPSEATPGDQVWPANMPARIEVPKGQRIAAAAVTGTGFLTIIPEV